jgi:hypothetical protein
MKDAHIDWQENWKWQEKTPKFSACISAKLIPELEAILLDAKNARKWVQNGSTCGYV